jgi:hypothetical protein
MGKNEIFIKIEDGINTKAFDADSVIHKDAFQRILELINQNLARAKNYNPTKKEDLTNNRVHNTITINGERGAGKTSFMLSIKKEYENNNEIEVLGILDPTLISTKQHVFILLISMIEEKVNEKFSDKCRDKKYDEKYKEWKRSLEDLAKGLNQLDGVGTNPYTQDLWDDSALVMAKGLSMAKAGLELEWKFHKFINKSLEILSNNNEKKAFLLFIDDIDTDFSKGWDVLEVLRKYITTPQIIPIMAGNFELYENLVRNEKSKLFKNLIEFDEKLTKLSMTESYKEKVKHYQDQMDELTQQYLMKVMQPINMINLHKLYYYLIYKNEKIFVLTEIDKQSENKNEENKVLLKKFMENVFNIFYKFNYPEYIDVITRLPLRTIFQWLFFAKIYENDKNVKAFLEANKDIFINNFFNLGINNEFFEIIKTKYGLNEFTSKFITIFLFEDLKEYRPIYNNVDLNISLMLIPQFLNLNNFLFYKLNYGIDVSLQFYLYDKMICYKDKKSIFNDLKIDKFLDYSARIKNIFNVIVNENMKVKFINQIYKEKNKINLSVFRKYLKKFNTEEAFEIEKEIKNYLEFRKNLNTQKNKSIYKTNIKGFISRKSTRIKFFYNFKIDCII